MIPREYKESEITDQLCTEILEKEECSGTVYVIQKEKLPGGIVVGYMIEETQEVGFLVFQKQEEKYVFQKHYCKMADRGRAIKTDLFSLTENNTAKMYFIVLSMNPELSRIYIRNGNDVTEVTGINEVPYMYVTDKLFNDDLESSNGEYIFYDKYGNEING